MSKPALLLSALIPALGLAPPAFAQEDSRPLVTLGGASDYVYRGVSRTDKGAQVFGSADWSRGDGYVGVWASNVRLPTVGERRDGAEIDLYGGWRPEFRGYDLDFGVIGYGFVDEPGAHASYAEAKAGIGRSIGPVSGGLSLYYSPAFFGRGGQAAYVEANAAYRITPSLSASAALGRQSIQRAHDYTTWNLGGTWSFTRRLGLDLRYWDTDAHGLGRPYGSKLVASLKARF